MEMEEPENIVSPNVNQSKTKSISRSITRTLFSNSNSNSDPLKNQSRVLFPTDVSIAANDVAIDIATDVATDVATDNISMNSDCNCSQESIETFITDANASFDTNATVTTSTSTGSHTPPPTTLANDCMNADTDIHSKTNPVGGSNDLISPSRKRTNSGRKGTFNAIANVDACIPKTFTGAGLSSFNSTVQESDIHIHTLSSSKHSARTNNANTYTNENGDTETDTNINTHVNHAAAPLPFSEEWLRGATNGTNATRRNMLHLTRSTIDNECTPKFHGNPKEKHAFDTSMEEELEKQNCAKFRRLNLSDALTDPQKTKYQQSKGEGEQMVKEDASHLSIRMRVPRTVNANASKRHFPLMNPLKGFKSPEENGGQISFLNSTRATATATTNKVNVNVAVGTFISPNDVMDLNGAMQQKVPSPPTIHFESDVISPSAPVVKKKLMLQMQNEKEKENEKDIGSPFAMATNMNTNMLSSFYGNYKRHTMAHPKTPMRDRKPPRRMNFTWNHHSSPSNLSLNPNPAIVDLPSQQQQQQQQQQQHQQQQPKEISRLAEDFDVVGTLGEGSFGTVYKCLSRLDGCTYAIKAAKRRSKGIEDRKRMLQEVKALAELSDVSDMAAFHVVRYHQAWIEDDRLHIVTDLCQSTLQMEMHQGIIKDDTQRQYKLLREMLLALKLIHKFGKVHLDIKPENIFVKDDKFKLGDFGLVVEEGTLEEVEEGDCRYMCKDLFSGNHRDLTKVSETICSKSTYYGIL